MRRPFDAEAVARRTLFALVLVGMSLGAFAWWLSGRLVAPFRMTLAAMDKMAQGDLRHRLETKGSTEVREAQVAFNRMADRIEGMLQSERTLMAGMSHELRTPLARLRLEIELLREKFDDHPRLDAMENDLREIDLLIDELFRSSRLALGGEGLTLEPVNLRELAERSLEQSRPLALAWSVEGGAPVVRGDPQKLGHLLHNLVQNAEKHARTGEIATIVLHEHGFEVVDRGPGVLPSDLPRLFEPFFRARTGARATGWGVGLMYALQIAEKHGGSLEARNVSPQGSRYGSRCRRGEVRVVLGAWATKGGPEGSGGGTSAGGSALLVALELLL
ncbi:MAG: HAMP domain-containing histidine kinase [Myxococcales bacterium]|nr:HAMP domain-containing histidine kinase [Myxococcales bacterium]